MDVGADAGCGMSECSCEGQRTGCALTSAEYVMLMSGAQHQNGLEDGGARGHTCWDG
jgi:hypothetical protein